MRLILPLTLLAPLPLAADPPRVVTDIAPVHSLVAQVMGDLGTPDVLVSGGASPHDFQFSFDQADAVQSADLVIWIGEDLTPWLEEPLETLAPDAQQVELLHTEGWEALDLRSEEDFAEFLEGDGHDPGHNHGHDDHNDEDEHDDHDGHDDHDNHDDHHARDPHAWLDPQVASAWVDVIAQALIEADPENSDTYSANAATAKADLVALEAEITALLANTEPTPFLVPHDAYQYFGARFDRLALAAISLSDATTPSPDKIAELQDIVATNGVTCVLSDPQARSEWSDLVAEGTDARTALVDPLGSTFDTGRDHYRQTLLSIGQAYADCLGG